MKPKFVIPLMLAAAIGGGTVVEFQHSFGWVIRQGRHMFLSAEEAKNERLAQRQAQSVRDYDTIADVLISLCGFDGRVRDRFQVRAFGPAFVRLEGEWWSEFRKLSADNAAVARSGPRLSVPTIGKSVEFLDSKYFCTTEDSAETYRYEGQLPKSGLHVVILPALEALPIRAVLVSPISGGSIDVRGGLFESSKGTRVAALAMEESDEAADLEIIHVHAGMLTREAVAIDAPLPVQGIEWETEETMVLRLDNSERTRLVLRSGKWQLEGKGGGGRSP